MKKYFAIVVVLAFIAACNSSSSSSANADTATAAPANDISTNPDYQKGLALIASSDCLTCHKVSEKLTGPAYDSVALRYENTDANVKMLAEKIIKGGSGNWGTVPMTAHAALTQADAEQMVKYILLLRNQ